MLPHKPTAASPNRLAARRRGSEKMKKWPDFEVTVGKAKKRGGSSYSQLLATASTQMPCKEGISARVRAGTEFAAKTQAGLALAVKAKAHLREHGCDKK